MSEQRKREIWRRLGALGPRGRNEWMFWNLRFALARQVREMRRARGWSLTELSRRARLGYITVWRMEHGFFSRLEPLKKIAHAFDCVLSVRFGSFSEAVNYYVEFWSGGMRIVSMSWDEEMRDAKG